MTAGRPHNLAVLLPEFFRGPGGPRAFTTFDVLAAATRVAIDRGDPQAAGTYARALGVLAYGLEKLDRPDGSPENHSLNSTESST